MSHGSPPEPAPPHLVLYDGICGFCNGTVRFLIARDPGRRLRYAALQSPRGRAELARHSLEGTSLSTLVVIPGDGFPPRLRSDAVVFLLRGLSAPWPICGLLLWAIPRPLRDWGYRGFARFRYALFGKLEACPIPKPSERALFLDEASEGP